MKPKIRRAQFLTTLALIVIGSLGLRGEYRNEKEISLLSSLYQCQQTILLNQANERGMIKSILTLRGTQNLLLSQIKNDETLYQTAREEVFDVHNRKPFPRTEISWTNSKDALVRLQSCNRNNQRLNRTFDQLYEIFEDTLGENEKLITDKNSRR